MRIFLEEDRENLDIGRPSVTLSRMVSRRTPGQFCTRFSRPSGASALFDY